MPLSKKEYIKKSCKCRLCRNGNPYSCRRGDNWCDKYRWRLGQKKYGSQREQLKEWNQEQIYLEAFKKRNEKLES